MSWDKYDLTPAEHTRYDYADQPEADTSGPESCVRHGYDGCDCYTPPPAATVTCYCPEEAS